MPKTLWGKGQYSLHLQIQWDPSSSGWKDLLYPFVHSHGLPEGNIWTTSHVSDISPRKDGLCRIWADFFEQSFHDPKKDEAWSKEPGVSREWNRGENREKWRAVRAVGSDMGISWAVGEVTLETPLEADKGKIAGEVKGLLQNWGLEGKFRLRESDLEIAPTNWKPDPMELIGAISGERDSMPSWFNSDRPPLLGFEMEDCGLSEKRLLSALFACATSALSFRIAPFSPAGVHFDPASFNPKTLAWAFSQFAVGAWTEADLEEGIYKWRADKGKL